MAKTYLDEIVEYPAKAIRAIGTDSTVVSLLTNNPDIDLNSDEADEVFDKYIFDYGYVDGTTHETSAYICVETELSRMQSGTIKDMSLYVTIICHKQYMKLDSSKFKGMIGNRRDNLVRYIDKLLNGADFFGIGQLSLSSVRTISSPNEFTAREITYKIPDFRRREIEGQ